jgi:tRNA pseudouridine38-40 synthase
VATKTEAGQAFRLTIEYDGSKYSGWAEQNNAKAILNEIRGAAEEVLRQPVELMGAGRTDAGVHARGQVAHLRFGGRRVYAGAELLRELNHKLPADIVILAAEPTTMQFHARHDAIARKYTYQISLRKSAFAKKYVWWIKEPLDKMAMREAAALLAGRHDFRAFQAKDTARPNESSIVVVHEATLEETEGGLLLFHIEASHFVWRMVRRLTGALVKVGLGEIQVTDFAALLENRQAAHLDVAAWTAPASGLFLEWVRYPQAPVTGLKRSPR